MNFSAEMLPVDVANATLAGRLLLDAGPTPVLIRNGTVEDVSRQAPTVADLMECGVHEVSGEVLFGIDELFALPTSRFLSPVDLQVIKAAGVTFAVSAIERVIEERARGDYRAAASVREKLEGRIGGGIRGIVPGSDSAARLKDALMEEGLWSQYLEVAIGPDAEIFTKAPPLASVGWGSDVGVRSDSSWNNPEPEIVLIVDSSGTIRGATLGNDVNLRDFEGRSALLLGKAKDNNASCAIGPFIRLFDEDFTLHDISAAVIELQVNGKDSFRLQGQSLMSEISREPRDLVRQAMSEHDYPDGFALFLGTLFAPTEDRDEPGRGFTHKIGDEVRIASPRLGALVNRVSTSKAAAPWTFGLRCLMQNLSSRGLLSA